MLLFSFVISIFATTMRIPIEYPCEKFVIDKAEWVNIHLKNGTISGSAGAPQYPSEALSILLPPASKIKNAFIDSAIWVDFDSGVPFPAQPPFIYSIGSPGIDPPDMFYYSQNLWFPEKHP